MVWANEQFYGAVAVFAVICGVSLDLRVDGGRVFRVGYFLRKRRGIKP